MGGRNPRSGRKDTGASYAGQYTIETVEFWMLDGRVQELSDRARCAIFYLGLFSTCERRECLPKWCNWSHLGRSMGAPRRSLASLVKRVRAELMQSGLVDETVDGRIIVCGARKRRANLRWKDEGYIDGINGYKNHQAVSNKQEELKGLAPARRAERSKDTKLVQLPDGSWAAQEV